jgi:hypothetical protein
VARSATVLLLALLTCGCAVRSLSDTARPWGDGNATYRGELNDLDVVGHGPGEAGPGGAVQLRGGQRVLVVQSGAVFPDEAMSTGLGEFLQVGTMSGVPSRDSGNPHGLRQAAARGGYDAVLCYWGVLESRERATAGMAVAWVPVYGWFVDSSRLEMRIRLRIVVLDVASGRWRCLLPAPIDDARAASLVTSNRKDAEQVLVLKEAAYRAAVDAVRREVLVP